MAATMFAAWALFPPSVPAKLEPTRFFTVFNRTISAMEHFKTDRRMFSGMVTSQDTDLPRPSNQFAAEGFLSVHLHIISPQTPHIFPDNDSTWREGK